PDPLGVLMGRSDELVRLGPSPGDDGVGLLVGTGPVGLGVRDEDTGTGPRVVERALVLLPECRELGTGLLAPLGQRRLELRLSRGCLGALALDVGLRLLAPGGRLAAGVIEKGVGQLTGLDDDERGVGLRRGARLACIALCGDAGLLGPAL